MKQTITYIFQEYCGKYILSPKQNYDVGGFVPKERKIKKGI